MNVVAHFQEKKSNLLAGDPRTPRVGKTVQ